MELSFLTVLPTTHTLHVYNIGICSVTDSSDQSFNANFDSEMQVGIV